MITNSPPIRGPIIVGQMNLTKASQFSEHPKERSFIMRLQFIWIIFLTLGCLSLVIAALLHHQRAALPWTLLTIVPMPILVIIITINDKLERPIERIVMIVDWLKQMPSMRLFSSSEKAKLGWLTDEGLYTSNKSHYNWKQIRIISLDQYVNVAPFETSHRLNLQLYEENAPKRWFLLFFLVLLTVVILSALNLLSTFIRHYGFREDVLSLTFAFAFDISIWVMFSKAFLTLNKDNKNGWKLPFFINSRHIQLDDLIAFAMRHQ